MDPVRSDLDRRALLQGSVSLAAAALFARSARAQATAVGRRQPVGAQLAAAKLELTAAPGSARILPGAPTAVWSYTGRQLGGTPGALTPIAGSHLGPILRLHQGQRAIVRVHNQLPENHVVHWHGLDVPAAMDGHPQFEFPSGSSYLYDFDVLNRAGTYWYHSHTDMRTGIQAFRGLAGPLIVTDAEEQALALPRGAFDVPLVLQDVRFDAANQLTYAPWNTQDGFLGDTLLVNGRPNFVLPVATRVYRLRLVNASTSRVYKLAWSDGTPTIVIGNDGGLLATPLTLPYVMLSPGERVELWADFRNHALGSQIVLRSLAYSGLSSGQGAQLDLLRVDVTTPGSDSLQLPATLSSIQPYVLQQAVNYGNPRVFPISRLMGAGFVLNGAPFQMTGVAANEIVRRDTLEHVRITNTTGMNLVGHPIHFHGRQFQVIGRNVTPAGLPGWQTVAQGLVDAGWKDTVLLMPGDRVKLLLRFEDYPGLYLYHCHMLEHEDSGLMRNYRVEA